MLRPLAMLCTDGLDVLFVERTLELGVDIEPPLELMLGLRSILPALLWRGRSMVSSWYEGALAVGS